MAEQNSIAAGLTALSQILEREKARGVDSLLLKPETEQTLSALPMELMKAATEAKTAAPAAMPATSPPVESVAEPAIPEEERNEKWVRG
ncbi:MAG: hypothetical protein HRU46_07160, partial [Verrucomicrobiales bacterium]|nr:hypothetical protein [Verrucomicrobiales bacterium]